MIHDRNQRGGDSVNLLSLYVSMQQCLYEFAFKCINKYINNKKLYIISSQMPVTEARWPRHLRAWWDRDGWWWHTDWDRCYTYIISRRAWKMLNCPWAMWLTSEWLCEVKHECDASTGAVSGAASRSERSSQHNCLGIRRLWSPQYAIDILALICR